MACSAIGTLIQLLRKSAAGRDIDALSDAYLRERFAPARDAVAFESLMQRFGLRHVGNLELIEQCTGSPVPSRGELCLSSRLVRSVLSG